MTYDEVRHGSCTSKQRFATAAAAWSALGHQQNRQRSARKMDKRREARKLTPYRCSFCHGWHYGYDNRRAGKARP